MNIQKPYLITAVLIAMVAYQGIGQTIKIMSYNIKYDNVNDTVNNWDDRKSPMVALLKSHAPDFIGMQEVLLNQLQYLDAALEDHSYIGVGREDGKQKGEFSPIYYNTKKYELLTSSTFWLSKNPDTISVGWDAALERICSYGLFKHKTSQKQLWVFNTHFDHVGEKARKNSVELVLKKIKQLNNKNLPVVLMGDFNLLPDEKAIHRIKKKMDDALVVSKTPLKGPSGTFNGFDVEAPMERRIDYIFTKKFAVDNYHHIDERSETGRHISDHLPVLTTVLY